MAWTGGILRTTGDIVTAAHWNAHMGPGGDLDHLFDGTKIQPGLVAPTSLNGTPITGGVPQALGDDEFEFHRPFENPITEFWN